MSIGKSIDRVDAFEKVTGRAKYVEDLLPKKVLVAKILHSTIANGRVMSFDTSEAEKLNGVVKVVTCFDVPDIQFTTAGHPWSTEKSHQDAADRKLLNERVRYYGDDIAAVICEDELTAEKALKLIKVTYEEYEPILTVEDALKDGVMPIHEECPTNILDRSNFEIGNYDEALKEDGLIIISGKYETQPVQHCHIETISSYAYEENGRIIIVSATQIPHIARRIVGQALGIKWGMVRIIKPYIGGGFGNKQDVIYEPLNAFLSHKVGGLCVKLSLTREETFVNTRIRHPISFELTTALRSDGTFVARKMVSYSNQGGYASQGHAVMANSCGGFAKTYNQEKALLCDAYTVYTNLPTGGAMRGYGIPQVAFAMESHIDDIARKTGLDPIELRLKNVLKEGDSDPDFPEIKSHTNGINECIEKGKKYIDWDKKRSEYKEQKADKRRGVGMGLFSYKTAIHPISLEHAGCRMALNQDGSVSVQMGATEIGQGADTVFTQMAAETLSVPIENVHIVTVQDTDVSPFDTGAYASRQSYVSGLALKKTAELLKSEILEYAKVLTGHDPTALELKNAEIYVKKTGTHVISLADLALESFYNRFDAKRLTAEVSNVCKTNTISTGVCFAEVEVDVPLAKVKVLRIINVHDSGTLLNPKLAEAQVHGGMGMGIGYALSEQMLFDDKGKPLNNNFLDYKLPTSMDLPELDADFVELYDPTGPYGNKSLGEPPIIPQGAAIRNAVLNATGVAFNKLPLSPQNMFEGFIEYDYL